MNTNGFTRPTFGSTRPAATSPATPEQAPPTSPTNNAAGRYPVSPSTPVRDDFEQPAERPPEPGLGSQSGTADLPTNRTGDSALEPASVATQSLQQGSAWEPRRLPGYAGTSTSQTNNTQETPASVSPAASQSSGSTSIDPSAALTSSAPEQPESGRDQLPGPGPEPTGSSDEQDGAATEQKMSLKRIKRRKVTMPNGEDLYVPRPGGKLINARRRAVRRRVGILAGVFIVCLSVVSAVALLGVLTMDSSQKDGALTQDDAARYGLDEFNTDAGASFGTRYLRACLSRFEDAKGEEDRIASVERMSAAADPACTAGVEGAGEATPARKLTAIHWAGIAEPVENMSKARYLAFDVTMDALNLRYVVPVYLDDVRTGAGPRVAGLTGVVPQARLGVPELDDPTAARVSDTALSTSLQDDFLPQVLEAWVASDRSLPQFLSPEASESAQAGLGGAVTQPAVLSATAMPPPEAIKESSIGVQEFEYETGMHVAVLVTVEATNASSKIREQSAYRVTIENAGSHWFLHDVRAASALVQSQQQPTEDPPNPTPSATPTG